MRGLGRLKFSVEQPVGCYEPRSDSSRDESRHKVLVTFAHQEYVIVDYA